MGILDATEWWVRNWETYMTTNPNPVAAESWAFWRPLVPLSIHAAAWLAMEDGESSFRPTIVGDHGEAFGPYQDHQARIDEIKAGCGIDLRTASHIDQLRGTYWEVTKGWYRHVWPELIATTTLLDATTVLVRDFEHRSAGAGHHSAAGAGAGVASGVCTGRDCVSRKLLGPG